VTTPGDAVVVHTEQPSCYEPRSASRHARVRSRSVAPSERTPERTPMMPHDATNCINEDTSPVAGSIIARRRSKPLVAPHAIINHHM
jgi:hypothetical protein